MKSNDAWTHIAYPKMAERLEALGLSEGGMRATNRARYVAREKIHGANLALHTDGTSVRAARRKEWIEDPEAFFRCGALLERVREGVCAVHRALGLAESARAIVYGELFGGRYPHAAVRPDASATAVQTGVWYSPSLAFAMFDVAIVGERTTFVGANEVDALGKRAGLLVAPVVASGALATALSVKLPFETKIPALLGLPRIAENWAEGVVVSPAERAKGALVGEPRVVLKRKIDRFAEDDRYAGAEKSGPFAALYAMVNEPRVAAAWSKTADTRDGREDELFDSLVDAVVIDVIEQWITERPQLAHTVHDRSEQAVTVRAEARRAVRAFLDARTWDEG